MLRGEMLPWLSWLEREAVNLKVGSSSLPGSAFATVRRGFRFFLLLGEVWRSKGLLRELNPGPLAPEARIMPLEPWKILQAIGLHAARPAGHWMDSLGNDGL